MSDAPEKLGLGSLDVAREKREALKALFPGVFSESDDGTGVVQESIDFEKLKAELGTFTKVYENRGERYGMNWPGKKDCLQTLQEISHATLRPCRQESVNFDDTENLFIEGDNLEVLKLLQRSLHGKVKMIYIDPPYNTGKEFIYPDNYREGLDTYLEYAGLTDDEGRKIGTNTQSEGRFHTNWLNMMYPRLYMARNLLREDGVIFISIDDNEVKNLRAVCDEIFGEENFVANIVWEKRFTRNNDAKLMSSTVEHILLFRKSEALQLLREPRTEKANSIYKNPDNDPRGPWTSVSFVSQRTKEQRPNLSYPVTNPITGENVEHPVNAWKYSKEQYDRLSSEDRLYWGVDGKNTYPRLKRFLSELDGGIVPINFWNYKDTGTIDDGTKLVDELIGKDIFDYPKPISLLKRMLLMATSKEDDIILDFFAGSCTTAHAVLDLNAQDGGNRKFIMVQLPEPCTEKTEAHKAGYKNIADIGKERIRRVIHKLEKEQTQAKAKQDQGTLLEDETEPAITPDLGFKVLKLGPSCFKPWPKLEPQSSEDDIKAAIQGSLLPVDKKVTKEDILYEIILNFPLPMSDKIETITLAGHEVYSLYEDEVLICLEDTVNMELIDAVMFKEPGHFICLESAFQDDDQLKTNAAHSFHAYWLGRKDADFLKTRFRTV